MRKRKHLNLELFALVLSFLLAFPSSLLSIALAETSSTTRVEHKPPKEKYFPGFRIKLEAEIEDKVGVLLARCYFKTKKDKNFGFVDMYHVDDADYRATLPAPWLNSEAVEYLFVIVNGEKKVSRTQLFIIEEADTEEATQWKEAGEIEEIRLDKAQEAAENFLKMKRQLDKYRPMKPNYQTVPGEESMVVKTDLPKTQVDLSGFHDNALVVEVPDNMKYGYLAEDLYSPAELNEAGGESAITSSTGATPAGTIVATSGGGGAAIVGIGLGVAALGGGAAAIFGSNEEEDEPPPINTSARVRWGDYGGSFTVADDAFELWFAGRFLGTSPTGSVGEKTVSGLEVGNHELQIRFITPNAGQGSFAIDLYGGATFTGGSTHQEGLLQLYEVRKFGVYVPPPS